MTMAENDQKNGNGRTKGGRFAPGHPFWGSKNGGKNGRKKEPKTIVSEAVDAIDTVKILKKLESLCLEGDARACMYLCDRKLGKPRQVMGLEGSQPGQPIQTSVFIMPGGARLTARELLNGGNDGATRTG